MNFQFDLNSKFEQLKEEAPRYVSLGLTALLVVAAVVHTLFERALAYYKENSETINEDFGSFVNAVRVGFPAAVKATRQAGADTRAFYVEYRPVVIDKASTAYEFISDRYNTVAGHLRTLSA